MSNDTRIDALERELRNERLCSVRMRLLVGVYLVASVVPQFQSIFNSMNVELPASTKMLLWTSTTIEDWGLFLLPLAWILWRVVEDRLLTTPLRLRIARHAITWSVVLIGFALYMPMLKLINNVG
jgi:type II secretory pathway component PulF